MELLTDVLAIVGICFLPNSAFYFFVKKPSETPDGEYSRKVRALDCSIIGFAMISASLVLG